MVSRAAKRSVALVVIAMFTVAGCSGQAEAPQQGNSTKAQIQALGDEQRESGNESQAKMLEDGVITDAEYRQAVSDARDCAASQGLEVTEVEKIVTLEAYSLSYTFEPGARSSDDALGLVDECHADHSAAVEYAWDIQHSDHVSSEAKQHIQACYESNGVEFPEFESVDELRQKTSDDSLSVFTKCLAQASDEIDK